VLHDLRLLSKEDKKDAKARIKALDKRDQDKAKTDEAKNDFESLIFEFRDFLRDDENQVYDEPSEIERLLEKCQEAEDWLDDAGSDVGY
jgi:molecular chaperone DnaK (HSP70)